MEIIHFDNILDNQLQLYWKGNEYYPPQHISEEAQKNLDNIFCTRYCFEGSRAVRDNYEKVYQECYRKLFELLFLNDSGENFAIYLENSLKLPNRIRTYRGLVSRKGLDTENYIEIEKSIVNKTLIAGVVRITKNNFKTVINLLSDSRTAFMLTSNHAYLSKETLEQVINKYRQNETHTSLNYVEIITNFCSAGDTLYKLSGDRGDNCLALDMFYKKSHC